MFKGVGKQIIIASNKPIFLKLSASIFSIRFDESESIASFILAFLSARYLFYDFFQTKGGIVAQKIKIGFEKNSLSYLFFLRLFPFFPFWLVNVVPALIGVQLKSYVVTTFLGIIPGTAIYASLGNGLGVAFDADAIPGLNKIFEPQILWPIVALSLVSLVPILLKSSRQRDQR